MTSGEFLDYALGVVEPFRGGIATLPMLECILGRVKPGMKTIETGCGLTTFAFAAAGASPHTLIDPQADKARAVEAAIDDVSLILHLAPSRRVLPRLLDIDGPSTYDFALMDGCDFFPDAVIDMLYLTMLLRSGGHLLMDDVNQPAVGLAKRILEDQSGWVLEETFTRGCLFRKGM